MEDAIRRLVEGHSVVTLHSDLDPDSPCELMFW
jgi:hypothetical protein